MKKYCILLIASLIGLSLSSAIEGPPEVEQESPRDDTCPQCFYNMITLNWPEAVCKLEDNFPTPKPCRSNLPHDFTIHGLWPQLNHLSSFISYCKNNKEKFDVKLLGAIHRDLNATWPSAYSMDATSFWKHEWDKHGSCTQFPMKKYFSESVAVHRKLPVSKWLSQAGIVPSNTRSYPSEAISDALAKHIPKTNFVLKCQTHNNSKQSLLKEIWICLKYTNLNAGSPCAHVTSTCTGNVHLIHSA